MTRRVLNLLTALSLLACVAAVVVWWRGYRVTDVLYVRWSGGLVSLDSRAGEVSVVVQRRKSGELLYRYRRGPRQDRPVRIQLVLQELKDDRDSVRFLRFAVRISTRGEWWVATVPTGFVAAATLVLPAAEVARRVRKRRRAAAGTCASCGYDLRATPDRCPECGAAASVTPSR